jgi:hypothetical protein
MAFLGMRGNGDWATDQRPLNWRESILYLYPNGRAPLTAIMSKMGSQKVDDPQFHWWTKGLPSQRAAITGLYTDSLLSSAYTSGGVAGDTVYVKMAAASVAQFREGHVVELKDASSFDMTVIAKVTARAVNGASSYIACYLLEDDDNGSTTSTDLSDADVAFIVGNANAEGAAMPDAIAYDPDKWYNYTQIFRTPLEMTRTAMQTRLRTGEQYKEAKREALELHSIEMEKAFLFGLASEGTGSNGKPERTTLGVVPAIRGGGTGSVSGQGGTESNFAYESAYSGGTWLQYGEEWLDTELEIMFRYGGMDKLALCGSGALLAINKLIKNGGNFDYSPTTESYGIKVVKWVTAHGTINIVTHPLMSYEATLRNSMVILEPKDIKFRYIQDTMFKKDTAMKEGSWTNRDGIKEEYLTEAGLEYHHPIGWGYLSGFGSDSAV